jgi:hypothetical protein
MNGDLSALALGTVLAIGALGFVLYPLFFDVRPRRRSARQAVTHNDDSAIRALREIEFDKATGKLSDADYTELKREYGAKAVRELRSAGESSAVALHSRSTPKASAPSADPIEDRVRAYRAAHRECRSCGLRPESDAIFCSSCGVFLDGRCPDCGASIVESSAGYCSHCGAALAAPA